MDLPANAEYWIEKLKMTKHPEGGFFVETYKCNESIKEEHLPSRFKGDRSFATGIYFLITHKDFSSLHKIAADEIWHFYAGSPLTVFAFKGDDYLEITLGNNFENNEVFQAVIPHGYWFGSRLKTNTEGFALVGCTVAPGFDFADFELGKKEKLIQEYPKHTKLIQSLTRQ